MKLLTDQRYGMWQEMKQVWHWTGPGIAEVTTEIVPNKVIERLVLSPASVALVVDDPWLSKLFKSSDQ